MSATRLRMMPEARERLLIRLDEINRQLAALKNELAEATTCQLNEGTLANHLADEASDMLLAETDLSQIGELWAEQREIAEAFVRIEAGSYGRCQECGAVIDPTRLEILPSAPRCQTCQLRLDDLLIQQQYDRRINFETRFAD